MNFKLILFSYLKKLWIVIILSIIIGGITYYISINYIPPIYEAKTLIYVMKKNNEFYERPLSFLIWNQSSHIIKDYTQLIKSYTVTSEVISELGLVDITPLKLSDVLSFRSKNDSNVFELTVFDSNPVRAKDIANKVSTVFIEKVRGLTTENNINIVDIAEIPILPVQTKNVRNICLSLAATFIGSSMFIIFILLFDKRIKTVQEVGKLLNLNVLGVIPKMHIK